jgi:hypothetical protein
MFGKLKDMGAIMPLISKAMSGDYSGLATMLKPQLIELLPKVIGVVIEAGGGDPATHGAWFFLHTKSDGAQTIMASIALRNELDEPGEPCGIIDVLAELEKLDLAQFISA